MTCVQYSYPTSDTSNMIQNLKNFKSEKIFQLNYIFLHNLCIIASMKTSEYEQISVVALHSVRIWMFCHILEANVIHMYKISNYVTEQEMFLSQCWVPYNKSVDSYFIIKSMHKFSKFYTIGSNLEVGELDKVIILFCIHGNDKICLWSFKKITLFRFLTYLVHQAHVFHIELIFPANHFLHIPFYSRKIRFSWNIKHIRYI